MPSSKLKILWVSDSPTSISAYGQQTALIAPALTDMGYEIVLYAPRLTGYPMKYKGLILLTGRDAKYGMPFGEDMIPEHCRQYGCNVVITMKDPYAFHPANMRNLGALWLPIVPVDSLPINEPNRAVLQYATRPVALSEHGQRELANLGYDAPIIPHAIDPTIFKPTADRAKLRKERGIDPDIFVAAFVGDNATDPPRKNIEVLLAAWALFHERHPDAELVLHTDVSPDRGGIDIMSIIDGYDIPRHAVRITSPYTYATGASPAQVAALYHCADVVVNIGNEGFGMPTIEAQACGVPVITCDWAASRDLTKTGFMIGRTQGDPYPNGFGSLYFRPFIKAVFQSLETAFEKAKTLDPAVISAQMTPFHVNNVLPLWDDELKSIQNLLEGKLGQPKDAGQLSGIHQEDGSIQRQDRPAGIHPAKAGTGKAAGHRVRQSRPRRGGRRGRK